VKPDHGPFHTPRNIDSLCPHAPHPSHPVYTVGNKTVYHYDAHCACGHAWTVLLEVEPEDDPMVECIGCGADVYDLRLVGQHHEAGADVEWH
jgi:hypothetical protein